MPWCQTCSRFLNPNTLRPDGACPECGRVVADPPPAEPEADAVAEQARAPWHFKLLLVLVVLYLGWRFVQIGGWIVDWILS
jgi:hypothetical protein